MTITENIAILDMEWTTWEGAKARDWSGPSEFREIVEIGLISITNDKIMVENGTFQAYIKPVLNPILSKYFIDLTGITQELVDEKGLTLHEAIENMRLYLGDEIKRIYSHGDDGVVFLKNCDKKSLSFPLENYQFINIHKTVATLIGKTRKNYASSDLPLIMGFEPTGDAHTALADCRCVAQALRIIRQAGRF